MVERHADIKIVLALGLQTLVSETALVEEIVIEFEFEYVGEVKTSVALREKEHPYPIVLRALEVFPNLPNLVSGDITVIPFVRLRQRYFVQLV